MSEFGTKQYPSKGGFAGYDVVDSLQLSSMQVCVINSDQEINRSLPSSNLFVDKSKIFRNIDISYIDACDFVTYAWDSYRFDGIFSRVVYCADGNPVHLCFHFFFFSPNFRYGNGNVLSFQSKAVCGLWRMRLTCAPESKSTLTRFWISSGPKMFAVITGSIDS